MFVLPNYAQKTNSTDSLIGSVLQKYPKILANQNKYKLQIIYTQINRDEKNRPVFKDYKYITEKKYFYPASTVKLPIATLALIKLEELNIPELNRETIMITDSAFFCQKKISFDSTSQNYFPSIENYIKKMFLVSDNSSCARVYEFIGFDYAHKKLSALGFKNIRLFNRLDAQCIGDTSKITPPIYFLNTKKDTVYKQSLTYFNERLTQPIANLKVGKAHISLNGKRIAGPKDFFNHNYLTATDLHQFFKKIVFNNYLTGSDKLPISGDSRLFMLKQLGLYPRESVYPKYDSKVFYDSYKKYFLYGAAASNISQDSIRLFNIVGRAYGFLTDCAYIIDYKNKIEFMLTVNIYVNEKNVIGNGKYQYEKVGLPFLKDLSWCFYNFEYSRKKLFLPDLSEFQLFNKN